MTNSRARLAQKKFTLLGGESQDIPAQGNYLRIVAALVPVIVEVDGLDVFEISQGQDVIYPPEQEFTRLNFKTVDGSSDEVVIMIGKNVRFNSALIAGSVSITNTASVLPEGGLIDQVTVVNNITGNVKTVDQGLFVTNSWSSQIVQAAGSVLTVFTPASNVNGVVIVDLRYKIFNAARTPDENTFIAKNGIPANSLDGIVICAPDMGSGSLVAGKISNIRIPAGLGLYYYATIAEQNQTMKNCLFRYL